MKFRLVLTLAAVAWLGNATAETTYFTNVNVIPMGVNTVLAGQTVVVSDGKISAVGPADSISVGEGRQIDGTGKYLIPALAEMHAHVPGRDNGEQYVQDILNLYLANGITTIRGMLGQPWHLELRDQLASYAMTGPRLITSGPSFNGASVTSPERAGEMARAQKTAGYDFLKLHPGLEEDEYRSIAATARTVHIPFAGHVSNAVGLALTLESGQATIDHLDGYAQELVPPGNALHGTDPEFFGINLASAMDAGLAPQLAEATRKAGVWNVPTQSLLENLFSGRPVADLMARPEMAFVRDTTATLWQNRVTDNANTPDGAHFCEVRRALILALHDAGAGLLLGSDAPQIMNVPGFSIHEELGYLVKSGLSPFAALQTGTVNVARFFNELDRGFIGPGYVADLVLLNANPLESISNTRAIEGVMRGGHWYDRAWIDSTLDGIRARKI